MKKGFLILSDMAYFVFFIMLAIVIYFFLFRELENNMENRVVAQNLSVDATYIALSLPHRTVDNTILQQAPPSTSPVKLMYFSDVARAVAAADEATLEARREYYVYTKMLDEAFGKDVAWSRIDKEKYYPRAYAVVLRTGDAYKKKTCRQYEQGIQPSNTGTLCGRITSSSREVDPQTGLRIPRLTQEQTISTRPNDDFKVVIPVDEVQVGTVFLPTQTASPLILQVFIEYEVKK